MLSKLLHLFYKEYCKEKREILYTFVFSKVFDLDSKYENHFSVG